MNIGKKNENNIFDLQWELLIKEIEINNTSIKQMHEFGKSIKNWTLLFWSATIGASISNNDFTKYIIFISAIPVLFWVVESYYRRIQSKFLNRWTEIKAFVNSDDLKLSKEAGYFINFIVLDVLGSKTDNYEYKKSTSLRRVMFFKTSFIFYLSLTIFTIIIWVIRFVLGF